MAKEKTVIIVSGAFGITITFSFMLAFGIVMGQIIRQPLDCVEGNLNIGAQWDAVIKLSFSIYLIWTLVGILGIVSAWMQKLRFLNCGLQCLMFILQFVATVTLACVRLQPEGISCADPTMGNA